MSIRIRLIPTTRTSRRQLYDAFVVGEKTPIVSSSWDPETDTCRALETRGLSGSVEFWHEGKSYPGLIVGDLQQFARFRIMENENTGPRFGRWRPFNYTDNRAEEPVETELVYPRVRRGLCHVSLPRRDLPLGAPG